jgi:hypothetical protein
MRTIQIRALSIGKTGTIVEFDRNPENYWYFVPGAKNKFARKAGDKYLYFPGQYSFEAIVEALVAAPKIKESDQLSVGSPVILKSYLYKTRNYKKTSILTPLAPYRTANVSERIETVVTSQEHQSVSGRPPKNL